MLIVKEIQEGAWREYQPGVEIKIRPIDKPTMRELRKKATRVVWEGRRRDDKLDETKFDHLVFRYVIEDWKGVVDGHKQPLPCSDDNKDRVTDQMISLSQWIMEEATSLAESAEATLEEEIKN